jgi:hypothetical protein
MIDSQTRTQNAATHARRAAIAAIAVAVLAGGAVTSASAQTGTTQKQSHTKHVKRFGVKFSPLNVIDVPPLQRTDGDYQPGDYTVFSDIVTNQAGRRIGTEGGSGLITKVSSHGAQVYFTLAIQLPHGQIAAAGLASTAPHKRLAVVGGTGIYHGADGRIDLVEHDDGTGSLKLTLH